MNEICIWKYMSMQKNSTTFQDVSKNQELYRCKYECYGYGQYKENGLVKECQYYRPINRVMIKYGE